MNDKIAELCQNLQKQGVNQSDISSIIEKVKNYYNFLVDYNIEQMDYLELLKAIQYAHFQYCNNVNDDNKEIWNNTQVYSDDDIKIWKPRNFSESCIIGTPQWCVSFRDFKWDEHVKYGGDTIYMIYNAWESGSKQFVSACVERNGNIILYDSQHNRIEDIEKREYLKSLGEGISVLKPSNNNNNQQIPIF